MKKIKILSFKGFFYNFSISEFFPNFLKFLMVSLFL